MVSLHCGSVNNGRLEEMMFYVGGHTQGRNKKRIKKRLLSSMDQKPFPEQEVLYFSQRKLCQTSGHAMSVVPDEEGAASRLPAPAATGHREKWLPSPTECFPTSFTNKSTNKVVFFGC